jgi:outer membrane receptor protein involved in Fe transport
MAGELYRDDSLGARDFVNTRLALEWDPSERLRTRLTVSAWQDQSENVAPQFRGIINRTPGTILKDEFLDYPIAPEEPRAADWDPGVTAENDNNFLMTSLRADYDLTSDLTLTSLTSYQNYFRDQPLEGDGTTFQNYYSEQSGSIETWYQELRLSGSFSGQGNWIVGLNAQRDETHDRFHQFYGDATSAVVLGVLGPDSIPETFQDIDTYAAFANAEYPVLDDVTVQAGIRYTDTRRDFKGCSRDGSDPSNPGWAGQSEAIQQFLRGLNGLTGFTEVPPGGCGTMGPAPEFEPGLVTDELDQDNISWRLNANWNVLADTLLYANVSQGYKAGSFPTLAIALSRQFEPVTQEKLLAYETGFKASLLESTLQLNGALFYYDYENKQILGSILDPIFGPLPALVNVPESHVQGFELSAKWAPIEGLRIDPGISYQDSEVDGQFSNFDFTGTVRDFSGESFPVAPEVQANLDVSYRWPLNERWEAFVGAHANYQDSSYSFFGEDPELSIDSYTLIDLRGGIAGEQWEFSVWGRNVTDEYYWNNANFTADALVRYAGMPATYGIDMKYRMGQ